MWQCFCDVNTARKGQFAERRAEEALKIAKNSFCRWKIKTVNYEF